MDFNVLSAECAPWVAPQTMAAIVKTESQFNPLAININAGAMRMIYAGRWVWWFSSRYLFFVWSHLVEYLCYEGAAKFPVEQMLGIQILCDVVGFVVEL